MYWSKSLRKLFDAPFEEISRDISLFSRSEFLRVHRLHHRNSEQIIQFLSDQDHDLSKWTVLQRGNFKAQTSAANRVSAENRTYRSIEKMTLLWPEIFKKDSSYSSEQARRTMRKYNKYFGWLEEKCQGEGCGLGGTWLGKKITLEIDHTNGVEDDHSLENLRYLCPNCHSQTETHRARNIPLKKSRRKDVKS